MRIPVILKTPAKAKKLPPLLTPKIGPGYLSDLMERLKDYKTRLPHPNGEPNALYTISDAAFEEASRLKDLALIPQIEQKTEQARLREDFSNLTHVISSLLENTGGVRTKRLLAGFLERIPNKPKYIESVLLSLSGANTVEAREFAWRFIPNKNFHIETNALNVLIKANSPKDYTRLLKLFGKKNHPNAVQWWIEALAATGKRRAVPVLKRFIDEYRKNRKTFIRYGVLTAEGELAKLN